MVEYLKECSILLVTCFSISDIEMLYVIVRYRGMQPPIFIGSQPCNDSLSPPCMGLYFLCRCFCTMAAADAMPSDTMPIKDTTMTL